MHSLLYFLIFASVCYAAEVEKTLFSLLTWQPREKRTETVVHRKNMLLPRFEADGIFFDVVNKEPKIKNHPIEKKYYDQTFDRQIEVLENLRKTNEKRSEGSINKNLKNGMYLKTFQNTRAVEMENKRNENLNNKEKPISNYERFDKNNEDTGLLKKYIANGPEISDLNQNMHFTGVKDPLSKLTIDKEYQDSNQPEKTIEKKVEELMTLKKIYEENLLKIKRKKIDNIESTVGAQDTIPLPYMDNRNLELNQYKQPFVLKELYGNKHKEYKHIMKTHEEGLEQKKQNKLRRKIPFETRKYKSESLRSQANRAAAAFDEYKKERNTEWLIHQLDEDYDKKHKEKGFVKLSDLDNDEKRLNVLEDAFKKLNSKNIGETAMKHKKKLYAKHYLLPNYEEIVKGS